MNEFTPGSLDNAIEADIDQFGLQHTIQRLELICAEKSAIIATHYDDKRLAMLWKLFSIKLKRLSQLAGEKLP